MQCMKTMRVTNEFEFLSRYGVMRRSFCRRNNVISRPQIIPWCLPPQHLRDRPPLANPDNTSNRSSIRTIHCYDFRQQWSRTSSLHLLKSKFIEPCCCYQRTTMCHWMWDVSHAPHHRYMLRSFSSNTNEGRSKSKRQQNYELSGKRIATDPFATLGIIRSPTLKFTSVKSTFLKIAMKYHPDTTGHCSEAEQEANKDLFVSARKAFELIMADPDGMAILKTEAHDYVEEEEDFEEWFRTETGYDMPFMDAATMKEVAEMTDTVGGGLDRDGGMWTLARMVANTVKEGGDGKSVLQLDAGVIRDRAIDGILRRKRKR